MNRRDLLLQEMNIPQWVLKKPQVLKGEAQIHLAKNVKLIVICDEDHQQSQLFQDILRTLQLQKEEYQWFTAEQAMRLQFEQDPILWILQEKEPMERLVKRYPKQTTWHYSTWQDLAKSPQKRQLWQQIQPFCQHFEDNQ
ncbi:DNA polymerase III subunit psi [Pasteurellaceae bacterium 15-036681]|nr:DNA polymerase III subunit psi [Pasteurellaceae bacterium 15-036681]